MGEQALGVAAVGARATGGLLGGGQYLMVQSRQLVKAQAQLNHVFAQLFEPIGFLHHRAGSVQVLSWGVAGLLAIETLARVTDVSGNLARWVPMV